MSQLECRLVLHRGVGGAASDHGEKAIVAQCLPPYHREQC
jgi:hypothetical protein